MLSALGMNPVIVAVPSFVIDAVTTSPIRLPPVTFSVPLLLKFDAKVLLPVMLNVPLLAIVPPVCVKLPLIVPALFRSPPVWVMAPPMVPPVLLFSVPAAIDAVVVIAPLLVVVPEVLTSALMIPPPDRRRPPPRWSPCRWYWSPYQ